MASARLTAPTQARGVEKRERIYQAAIARFRQHGVKATRVEDVIGDAGVSWATFFRYFPRKEDVLLEAAARHFREHVKVVPRPGSPTGDCGCARSWSGRSPSCSPPPTSRASSTRPPSWRRSRARRGFADFVGEGPFPMVQLVAALLSEGQLRGEVDQALEPPAAAMTVVAGVVFPAVQAAAAGHDPRAGIEHALAVLWRGLGTDD